MERRERRLLLPVVSTLAVVAGAGFAFYYGIAAIPPFVALLLFGALANVLFRMTDLLKARFDNVVTSALRAIAFMLSTLTSAILVCWALWVIFSTNPNPIEQFLAHEDGTARISAGIVLFAVLAVAFLGLLQAASLWLLVRANSFGAPSSLPAEEDV